MKTMRCQIGIKVVAPAVAQLNPNFKPALWLLARSGVCRVVRTHCPGMKSNLWSLLCVSPSGAVYPQLSHSTSVFAKSLLSVDGISHLNRLAPASCLRSSRIRAIH